MELREYFLHFQHSESEVARMAASIYAGYLSQPATAALDEDLLVQKSVDVAIKIALFTGARARGAMPDSPDAG